MRNVFLKFIFMYIFFVIFNFICLNFLFAEEKKEPEEIDSVFWSKKQIELMISLKKSLKGTNYKVEECRYIINGRFVCYVDFDLESFLMGQ